MATQAEKGWMWTLEEKRWIKTWKRQVQSKSKWLTEQVNRFQNELPAFADEAAKSAQSYLRTAKALLTLAEGANRRTYLPVSPDEAKQLLYGSEDHLLAWSAFSRRPDLQAAIRDANRKIRAQKRALQKQRREGRVHNDPQITAEDADEALKRFLGE